MSAMCLNRIHAFTLTTTFLWLTTMQHHHQVSARNHEYYVLDSGTELVRFVPDGICEIYGAKSVVDLVLLHADKGEVRHLYAESFIIPLKNCTAQQSEGIFKGSYFPVGLPWAIMPGTKWCGEGNIASNFYDLGHFTELDKCCREHDFCADYINPRSAGKNYDDLLNLDMVTTGYHCDCDQRLRNCLKRAKTLEADVFGKEYFSHQRKRCFNNAYPTERCLIWDGLPLWGVCRKYELNYLTDQKMWQFFNNEPFISA